MFSLAGLRRSSRLGVPEIDARYKVLEELGKGNFAVVKKIRDRDTQAEYALKIIDKKKSGTTISMVEKELSILKSIRHPHIVGMTDSCETSDSLYLVMEYCAGGELFDRIMEHGMFSENDASSIIRQVVMALVYLHSKGIVHRDLKPENLLLTSKNVISATPITSDDYNESLAYIKVTDFGLSNILTTPFSTLRTACGTPGYVAPEVLLRHTYGAEVDMWSVGVLAYILLCGYPPFYDDDQRMLLRHIVKGAYEFHLPYWQNISDSAKDLIRKLLIVNPVERLTAEQCLNHPWVKGFNVPTTDIFNAIQPALKKEMARRKFRSAVNVVKIIHRMAKHKK